MYGNLEAELSRHGVLIVRSILWILFRPEISTSPSHSCLFAYSVMFSLTPFFAERVSLRRYRYSEVSYSNHVFYTAMPWENRICQNPFTWGEPRRWKCGAVNLLPQCSLVGLNVPLQFERKPGTKAVKADEVYGED